MIFKKLVIIAILISTRVGVIFGVTFEGEDLSKINVHQIDQIIKKISNKMNDSGSLYYNDEDFEDNGEPEIDFTKALKTEYYQANLNKLVDSTIISRIKRALDYKKNGNIDKFKEITYDLIKRYPLNENTAQVAYLQGNFEELINNLEEAQKFYTYVVNTHFYSSYGIRTAIRLAYILEKRNYHIKSENLLFLILDQPRAVNINSDVLQDFKKKLIRRSLWYCQKKKISACKYYLIKLDKIEFIIAAGKFKKILKK